MINLEPSISTIEELLTDGTDSSLTYAALECRLAIERICYDRLRQAHDYISHDDLRKWQPHAVVNRLIEEVDTNAAQEFSISISKQVPETEGEEPTAKDYEVLEWVELGTQAGFDPKKISRLWNGLSNVALHCRMPMNKGDVPSAYGEKKKIELKVREALDEIMRIATGTLVASGVATNSETTSVNCGACGSITKRRAKLLKNGQQISCINPSCIETFDVELRGDEVWFERRVFEVYCNSCSTTKFIPKKLMERLAVDQIAVIDCEECPNKFQLQWFPKVGQLADKSHAKK